jgi:hypothetical protein
VKTRAEFDSRVDEWIYFIGGAKDGGWEILPKGKYEWLIPVIPAAHIITEEITPMVMVVGSYRYNGRQMMAMNEMGYMVPFRCFDWEGER